MILAAQAQALHEALPPWGNLCIIAGSAALSWLAPIASFVAIVWGCLCIYGWIINRGWRRKSK